MGFRLQAQAVACIRKVLNMGGGITYGEVVGNKEGLIYIYMYRSYMGIIFLDSLTDSKMMAMQAATPERNTP